METHDAYARHAHCKPIEWTVICVLDVWALNKVNANDFVFIWVSVSFDGSPLITFSVFPFHDCTSLAQICPTKISLEFVCVCVFLSFDTESNRNRIYVLLNLIQLKSNRSSVPFEFCQPFASLFAVDYTGVCWQRGSHKLFIVKRRYTHSREMRYSHSLCTDFTVFIINPPIVAEMISSGITHLYHIVIMLMSTI